MDGRFIYTVRPLGPQQGGSLARVAYLEQAFVTLKHCLPCAGMPSSNPTLRLACRPTRVA